jgi:hypothetical protein
MALTFRAGLRHCDGLKNLPRHGFTEWRTSIPTEFPNMGARLG